MNIFIIGPSRSGKTTLANHLKVNGYNHIQASKALKNKYPIGTGEEYDKYVLRLTKISNKILQENPDHFIEYIKSNMIGDNVIEGIRNPRDFCFLYNPVVDKVIITDGVCLSDFEKLGIEAILAIIKFWNKDVIEYDYTKNTNIYSLL